MNYYNEHDKNAAAWLRELIKEQLIPDGYVDERSIKDVATTDLRGYSQHHFFAGIGGWSAALDLARWPRNRPVFSGSCPCQSFSVAGKRKGFADARDLWPVWFELIRECRPAILFGEQVESAIRYGWLDRVRADLEGCGYAVGSAVLPACGVGSPHIRHRLFWVAQRLSDSGPPSSWDGGGPAESNPGERPEGAEDSSGCGNTVRLAVGDCGLQRSGQHGQQPGDGGLARGVGNSDISGREGRGVPEREGAGEWVAGQAGGETSFAAWSDYATVRCGDGKLRRIPAEAQPGVRGVVDGLSAGVGGGGRAGNGHGAGSFPLTTRQIKGRAALLRGLGNAIVIQVAAEFIRAFLESEVT